MAPAMAASIREDWTRAHPRHEPPRRACGCGARPPNFGCPPPRLARGEAGRLSGALRLFLVPDGVFVKQAQGGCVCHPLPKMKDADARAASPPCTARPGAAPLRYGPSLTSLGDLSSLTDLPSFCPFSLSHPDFWELAHVERVASRQNRQPLPLCLRSRRSTPVRKQGPRLTASQENITP